MVNLILKDLVIHKKLLLGMFLGIVAYMLLDASVMLVAVVFTMAIVMSIFANDEKKSIQMLLGSLPFTRREVVSSKYIVVFIYTLLVFFTTSVSNYAINQQLPNGKEALIVICSVMLLVSILFPLTYKFSSKYLTIITIVVFFICIWLARMSAIELNDEFRAVAARILAFQDVPLVIGVGVVLTLLYFLSWRLSVRIYENKIFM